MPTKLRRQGFTLIELLIVVSIISILSAIAIPQYGKYRQRAQNAVAVAAIDQIVTAQQLFFTDKNHFALSYKSLASLSLTRDININYGALTTTNGGADFRFTLSHKAPGATLFTYDSSFTSAKFLTQTSAGLSSSVW
ncbi:MAG: prepilin-type N-terminal cleavage/methylation domain-containing protein [Deltaproteobacteria bacterium]|jgi:type IV pilus assembly protein PilA|nr:prepilin-type N-terminal cleavage/methylation domain-containing protein [Deltaproteobacteria bacterium]